MGRRSPARAARRSSWGEGGGGAIPDPARRPHGREGGSARRPAPPRAPPKTPSSSAPVRPPPPPRARPDTPARTPLAPPRTAHPDAQLTRPAPRPAPRRSRLRPAQRRPRPRLCARASGAQAGQVLCGNPARAPRLPGGRGPPPPPRVRPGAGVRSGNRAKGGMGSLCTGRPRRGDGHAPPASSLQTRRCEGRTTKSERRKGELCRPEPHRQPVPRLPSHRGPGPASEGRRPPVPTPTPRRPGRPESAGSCLRPTSASTRVRWPACAPGDTGPRERRNPRPRPRQRALPLQPSPWAPPAPFLGSPRDFEKRGREGRVKVEMPSPKLPNGGRTCFSRVSHPCDLQRASSLFPRPP